MKKRRFRAITNIPTALNDETGEFEYSYTGPETAGSKKQKELLNNIHTTAKDDPCQNKLKEINEYMTAAIDNLHREAEHHEQMKALHDDTEPFKATPEGR